MQARNEKLISQGHELPLANANTTKIKKCTRKHYSLLAKAQHSQDNHFDDSPRTTNPFGSVQFFCGHLKLRAFGNSLE